MTYQLKLVGQCDVNRKRIEAQSEAAQKILSMMLNRK